MDITNEGDALGEDGEDNQLNTSDVDEDPGQEQEALPYPEKMFHLLQIAEAFIALGGKYLMGAKNLTLVPMEWYHVCYTVSTTQLLIYVNGEINIVHDISARKILLNASMVLGQETDQVLGGYQEQQSFSGIITEFNLYNRVLTEEEVQSQFQCENFDEGDLIAWSTTLWEKFGSVQEITVNQEDYCNTSKQVTVFPERRSFREAIHWCDNQKAKLHIPRSVEENVALYSASKAFLSVCQPPNHATVFLWLGATDEENNEYLDMEGNPLMYENFNFKSSSASQTCLGMMIPPNAGKWDDTKCSSLYQFCVPCEETVPTMYKMRGLCEEDEQAILFRLGPEDGKKTSFRGFTKFDLKFNEENKTWMLTDMWTKELIASYFAFDGSYPLGTHTWKLTTDYYVCGKPKDADHVLALSACYDWEYSCEDATCINLTQRCDLRVDCPDASDEKSCEKLSLPEDYLSNLTPPGVEPGPLNMNLNMSLFGFSEINLRDMKLTVDFTLTLSWYDIRLQYLNLKELIDINYVERSKVWTPKLEFLNADFPKVHETTPVLTIRKETDPEPDDPVLTAHNEVFEGSKNPIQMTWKVNAPFSCSMDLQNFPFDAQHCQLLLRLTSARVDFLQWNDLEVIYLGEVWLTEYQVGSVTIDSHTEQDYSVASVNIKLYRRFWFYITSTYLPTIMLMLISYTSLFLKRDNMDLRVMMTLTTLLVLYALYQQIAEGLPKTSYTKAIDVWCFFAITFIFTQVIFQVVVDVRIKRKSNPGKQVSIFLQRICWQEGRGAEAGEYLGEEKEDPPKTNRPLKAARYCYALIVIIFFIVYWIVVIGSMKE
ncbi:uncharacterized protein [Palaemon carinicauda]|uniref:uncharacterized protein n=1 Tax=Palaemon carinicauda TaxID=392227 RepID=UPI0035B679E4